MTRAPSANCWRCRSPLHWTDYIGGKFALDRKECVETRTPEEGVVNSRDRNATMGYLGQEGPRSLVGRTSWDVTGVHGYLVRGILIASNRRARGYIRSTGEAGPTRAQVEPQVGGCTLNLSLSASFSRNLDVWR